MPVKPILPKELFVNIDSALDKLKSKTISFEFGTLCLCIVRCFCHILEKMIYKGSLVFNLLFKLGIDSAFAKKLSKARRTLGDFGNSIRGKTPTKAFAQVVDQGALVVENISEVKGTFERAFWSWIWGRALISIVASIVDWGVLVREKISRVRGTLRGASESWVWDESFADVIGQGTFSSAF